MIPNKEFCDKFGGRLAGSGFGYLCVLNYENLPEAGLDMQRMPRNGFSALVIIYDHDIKPWEKDILEDYFLEGY